MRGKTQAPEEEAARGAGVTPEDLREAREDLEGRGGILAELLDAGGAQEADER